MGHHHSVHEGVSMAHMFEPGLWVRLPSRPDWGDGQVQSVVGYRVTVSFEHAGKILVNTQVAILEPIDD
jgi:hypothetical protein